MFHSRVLFLGAALLSFAACSPKISPQVSSSSQDAGIVHGKTLARNDELGNSVVALVSELSEGQALCTGSILSRDLILTAAHCVEGDPSRLMVVFARDVRKAKPEEMRSADLFVQNPLWKTGDSQGQGDLALIHFQGGLPAGYEPVALAGARLKLRPGDETLLVGYGVSNGRRHSGSGLLRETVTTVLDDFSPTELVTDGRTSSVCFGDSGGPAFVQQGAKYVQWGVANSVLNQSCSQASVHTDLLTYRAWIKSAGADLRQEAKASSGPSRHRSDPNSENEDWN